MKSIKIGVTDAIERDLLVGIVVDQRIKIGRGMIETETEVDITETVIVRGEGGREVKAETGIGVEEVDQGIGTGGLRGTRMERINVGILS
jgi:hypothetical protein